MNRALAGLGLFALVVAAAFAVLYTKMPPPELPARPELFPPATVAYVETTDLGALLRLLPPAGNGIGDIGGIELAPLAALPVQRIAVGLVAPDPSTVQLLVLLESRDPAGLERAILDRVQAVPGGPWTVREMRTPRSRWLALARAGSPVVAVYRGRGTVAVAVPPEPLEPLIAGKRHGAPTLADNPAFLPAAAPAPGTRWWADPAAAGGRSPLAFLAARLQGPAAPGVDRTSSSPAPAPDSRGHPVDSGGHP